MYSFHEILGNMMETIPDTMDKRQGSVAYNALAPVAVELSQAYISLGIYNEQTHLMTAAAQGLDDRAMDFSIPRYRATPAFRLASTFDNQDALFNAPIGSRFSVPDMLVEITYVLREYLSVGNCVLECEQPGTIGNAHIGLLLPIHPINNLGRAEITGTQRPGRDTETDEEYRRRVIDRLSQKAFGGNVADYKEFVGAIDGVGALKVFPAWQGGGTVLISVIDSGYDPITPEFSALVKSIVDPEEDTGLGIGVAPIGHSVTVTTPERFNVNIQFTAILDGVTPGQIQSAVEASLDDFFRGLRMEWSASDTTWIYHSRVMEAIQRVQQVVSVSNLTLNGSASNISLTDTTELQRLPYTGSVSINV